MDLLLSGTDGKAQDDEGKMKGQLRQNNLFGFTNKITNEERYKDRRL